MISHFEDTLMDKTGSAKIRLVLFFEEIYILKYGKCMIPYCAYGS